jgi:hypothetical protein
MANIRSGNTWYVDTASESLSARNIALVGLMLTGAGGAGTLVLGDDVSGASYPTKLEFRVDSGPSTYLDFSSATIIFPNGIRVKTATTVAATLILRIPGESS